MSDAYIPVAGTTDNLQTYRNNIGGVQVDSEAVTLTTPDGLPIGETNKLPVDTGLVQPTTPADTQPVSGTVAVSNFPVTQPVSGTVSVAQSQVIKRTVTVTTSGDNTVITPTAGKAIQLISFGYSAGASVSGCLVQLKLDGYNSGVAIDSQYLVAAGQAFSMNMGAGDDYIQGSVNGLLTVNLSASQTVYVNVFYLEV